MHVDKHQSFCKLALSFLINLVRHVQSTQNRKLVILLHYIEKKVPQLLLCFIMMQNIQIFYGGSVMFVVTYCYFHKANHYCIKLSPVSSKQYRLCLQQGLPLQLFYFLEVTPKEQKRNYHVWKKESKSAFEMEFAKHLEK